MGVKLPGALPEDIYLLNFVGIEYVRDLHAADSRDLSSKLAGASNEVYISPPSQETIEKWMAISAAPEERLEPAETSEELPSPPSKRRRRPPLMPDFEAEEELSDELAGDYQTGEEP
jgi:hypothetical protein